MQKNYVLDTNILFEDKDAIKHLINGEENKIYIPMAVLFELDKLKKEKPNLVKKALIQLEEYADKLCFLDTQISPPNKYDYDIVESASFLTDATIVSNDRILRFIANACYDVKAEEYLDGKPDKVYAEEYTGIWADEIPKVPGYYYNNGKLTNWKNEIVRADHIWGVVPATEAQKVFMSAMLDEDLEIISCNSGAGFGKTYLALATALYFTFEYKKYTNIKIVRPLVESGNRIGFLPGDVNEKINQYFLPVLDLISELNEMRGASKLFNENGSLNTKKCQLIPVNFLRGANFKNTVLIIDEAQNITRDELRTILTRCGRRCKVFILGDVNQVDNPILSKENNGLNWLVTKLHGSPNYFHCCLSGKNMRGSICETILRSGL